MSFFKIHDIHPYHAKFYPGIPQYFLAKYANNGAVILDPFCGSGTTLLECDNAGYKSYGIDINFLSAKITFSKIQDYSKDEVSKYIDIILNSQDSSDINFKDSNLWFTTSNYTDLCLFYNAINSINEEKYRTLFEVLLSSLLNRICNKRDTWNLGYLSDGILPNKESKLSLRKEFIKKCKWIINVCEETKDLSHKSMVICGNSKTYQCEEAIDMVITSPPYPFAVDFARNNRLSYYLFHQDIEEASKNETGARYKRNKRDCERLFFEEMKDIYLNVMSQVKIGGLFCMTVADTKRNNKPIYFVDWLKELFLANHWEIVEDGMRQLQRQSMGQKRIPEEHVIVFKKNNH